MFRINCTCLMCYNFPLYLTLLFSSYRKIYKRNALQGRGRNGTLVVREFFSFRERLIITKNEAIYKKQTVDEFVTNNNTLFFASKSCAKFQRSHKAFISRPRTFFPSPFFVSSLGSKSSYTVHFTNLTPTIVTL